MNVITIILSAIPILNIIFVITLIFSERRNPTATWAWLLILITLPFLGFILYLFFGLTPKKRRIFNRKTAKDKKHKQNIIKEDLNCQREKISQTEQKNIIQLNSNNERILYSKNNDIELYHCGEEKFRNLFKQIRLANHHIHICYYIIRDDSLGKALVKSLAKKAREGVEVRVLYDSVGCRKLPDDFFDELKVSGGKIARFYPSFLDINYRNHRKIVVIDGKIGFVGGANVGLEYLGLSDKFGFWRDTHLKVVGEATKSLQERFLLDWNFATNENILYSPEYYPTIKKRGNTGMQIVTSGPDSSSEEIKAFFLKMIYSAEKSIYLQSPYFIPDESILEALQIAASSGVDIKIVIPDKPDHPFVFWANRSYLGLMLEYGAEGYVYKKGFLHSKLIIIDGQIASVGTANMDVRSFKLNFEINSFLYDNKIAGELQKQFLKDLDDSSMITEEDYNKRGISTKFKESVSRLLSPIL
ncbi:cardiolipin synthase [Natranaerobius trueperi]|uniref:cardiolipin synthase n=1 Tax=Natranaerobius trueperi TaxID=759412 RepID=UPI00197C23A8|nr:cardiolipin synthase [Natranaerobius trueperi]